MPRKVIGIRTNTWSNMEEILYNQLLQAFSAEDIFVIADETKSVVRTPKHIRKIEWNHDFIRNHGLLDYNHFNRGIGWLCGDYCYYVFKERIDSDFYWLIEPDVKFTFEHLKEFFDVFEGYSEDALLANFEACHDGDWYWYRSSTLITNQRNAYRCLFPLSRLSASAIDACKNERCCLSRLYKNSGALSYDNNPIGVHFPNDEALVASTLMRDNFKVLSFNAILPNCFDYFDYHNWFVLPQGEIIGFVNSVIHPARPASMIAKKLSDEIMGDIQKNNFLNSVIADHENIDLISSQVGINVTNYIHSFLETKINRVLFLSELKSFLLHQCRVISKLAKIWVYEEKVLVIDFPKDDKTYALDLVYNESSVVCYVFLRSGGAYNWMDEFKDSYPDARMEGYKLRLFDTKISNKEQLLTQIQDAVGFYHLFIQNR